IPARANSSAAAAAAICSLSTSTPLQSKITTGAPRRRACSTAVVSTNRAATEGIVGPWQKSGAARPRDVFTQLLRFAGKAGIIVRRGRKWPEKRLVQLALEIFDAFGKEIVGNLVLDGAGEDRFVCGERDLGGRRAHVGQRLSFGLSAFVC